jgi:hypothetical protein
MNPTAADYEQAIKELREGLYTKPIDPAELVVGPTLDWIANRARDIAAARQTDSVGKVIADMRMYYGDGPARGDLMGLGFADRLEALGNGK